VGSGLRQDGMVLKAWGQVENDPGLKPASATYQLVVRCWASQEPSPASNGNFCG
jgi:hypothetical protein